MGKVDFAKQKTDEVYKNKANLIHQTSSTTSVVPLPQRGRSKRCDSHPSRDRGITIRARQIGGRIFVLRPEAVQKYCERAKTEIKNGK